MSLLELSQEKKQKKQKKPKGLSRVPLWRAPSTPLVLVSAARASPTLNQQIHNPGVSWPSQTKRCFSLKEQISLCALLRSALDLPSSCFLTQDKKNILGDHQKRGQEPHPAFHGELQGDWAVLRVSASFLPLGQARPGVTVDRPCRHSALKSQAENKPQQPAAAPIQELSSIFELILCLD